MIGISSVGFFASSGGGSAYDTDAQAFFTANSTLTDAAQKNAINQHILDLKSFGLFTKLHAMWYGFLGSSTKNSYNVKNTAFAQLTYSSGWTFTGNKQTPNGISSYADTQIKPTDFNKDNFGFGVYLVDDSFKGVDIGCSTSRRSYIFPTNLGSTLATNTDNAISFADSNTSNSFYHAHRTSSTLQSAYKNGVLKGTETTASFYESYNIWIGSGNRSNDVWNPSNKGNQLAYISQGFTLSDVQNFETAFNTLKTSLGI